MNTEEKLGIKKPKAILLFVQMLFIILLLAVSIYLLIFVSANNLGGWMIASYVFITLSVLSFIVYSCVGYKKESAYLAAIVPFLGAIFVNILLPQRNTFQIALLVLLFALVTAFLLRQKDRRFTFVVSLLMMAASLTFSIYSSITARLDFLGNLGANGFTYFAMYASIFVPTVMSFTLALTYNVKVSREAR